MNDVEVNLIYRSDEKSITRSVNDVIQRFERLQEFPKIHFHLRLLQVALLARDACLRIFFLQIVDALLKSRRVRRRNVDSCTFSKCLVCNSIAYSRRAAKYKHGFVFFSKDMVEGSVKQWQKDERT